MFSKPAKTTEGADHHAPRKPMPASLIGEGMAIKGDLNATGDLHLDGAVEGDIAVERLTLGESGSVTGAIKAESVDIRGRVTGTISARVVRLAASAKVYGDITHTELAIEAGAHFEGRSLSKAPVAPAQAETLSIAAPDLLSVAAE